MNKGLRHLLCILLCVQLGACAVTPAKQNRATQLTPPVYARERMALDDVEAPLEIYDPWEAYNRRVYWLNAGLDDYALNPAVGAYRRVTPAPLRQGVTNFFDNLDDIRTLLNQVLQLRFGPAWDTSRRFATNSTVGVLGLFDPATRFGIAKHDEDFGQTLGRYGVAEGPYFMLPLFGPSTLRDALGRGVDMLALGWLDPLSLEGRRTRQLAYYPLLVLDTRATTAFQYFETGSPFEYELVRLLFVTKRELDVVK